MKKFFATLIIVFFVSCAQSTEKNYRKNGVSFTVPAGWSIEEESFSDASGFISCEKNGLNASGLLMIGWINRLIDLERMAQIERDSVHDKFSALHVAAEFVPSVKTQFGKYKGIKTGYTFTLVNLPHRGTVYIFNAGKRTYAITIQEALEDEQSNADGLALIAKTFECLDLPEKQ
jgi:hypothetical protein